MKINYLGRFVATLALITPIYNSCKTPGDSPYVTPYVTSDRNYEKPIENKSLAEKLRDLNRALEDLNRAFSEFDVLKDTRSLGNNLGTLLDNSKE